MTGHGHSSLRFGAYWIEVEVRSVNNRFLKVTSKVSDPIASLENQIEGIVREHIRRGSVTVSVRVVQDNQNNASRICLSTLQNYLDQCRSILDSPGAPWSVELGSMLQLPGVLDSPATTDTEDLFEHVAIALKNALANLNEMRCREGTAMANQLSISLEEIRQMRAVIERRAPIVIDEYRRRLEARVRLGLSDAGHSAPELDILREVLVFSDKCDIREELVRLSSHLDQFQHAVQKSESQGRPLDFLTQELLRETNTIGSKANDAEIAHAVVSIKTWIEQMRELVQNIE
jgi:uncharacterized protein (TIGR00255 family)